MLWRIFVFTSSEEYFGSNLVWSSFLLKRCSKWMLVLRPWNHHLCLPYERTQSKHRPGNLGHTHFSCFPIVIYRQFVQIGKRTPLNSRILFNWVFAFFGAVRLRFWSLAPRFSCHRVYSISNEESEEELLPHSFCFLCPFLDRSVESACCYEKPVRAPGADKVVIIGVINVGFAIDSTAMIP